MDEILLTKGLSDNQRSNIESILDAKLYEISVCDTFTKGIKNLLWQQPAATAGNVPGPIINNRPPT